ncbi:MAG: Rne/Rng family ribonuclease [Bacteroidales bacterium]|nr:Rne/Rng family ribonuclease [Bacteroidales bacterium]
MDRELVIDVHSSEIIIALLEDKQLVELNKERSDTKFSVGDIYLGKVKKIMPSLNAAFVDIGYEKDAFLHYLDFGHQFLSLTKFLKLALYSNQKLPSFSKFKLEKDIEKDGKISDVLTKGQEILVQIAKEPISTKGPRLTSEISLAGRNLVLLPFSNRVSISQKIENIEERDRLKRLLESIKPKNYGIIIRTVGETKKVADFDSELKELVKKWENGFKNLNAVTPPKLIIGELKRTSAILRDILNKSFNYIYVNDESLHTEIREYIKTIAPEKEKIVKYYQKKIPIFQQYGVDKQIKALFGKTVAVSKGAYIVIEHTEALHVIDVNSGNRGKSNNNQEENAFDVNMAAAQEIARQLRLRDMGGIIVIDFIDMHKPDNRYALHEKMKELMLTDRAKHHILQLSKFGLMQITRQRVRPEMHIETFEKCPTCRGTGEVSPSILFIDELENKLSLVVNKAKMSFIILNVHPYIAGYINKGMFSIRFKWFLKFRKKIKVHGISSYNLLEYNFFDNNGNKIIY